MSDPPLPHIIAPDEVETFLAGSVVRTVTYHRTSRFGAQSILERGIDISRSRIGAYGQGFYTTTESDPFFGDVVVTLAVRLVSPLYGDENWVAEVVNHIAARLGDRSGRITPEVAAGIRQELMNLGYDGIVVIDGGGDGIDYVIALEERVVKVVS